MNRLREWISGHRWTAGAVAAATLLAAVAIVLALTSGDSAKAGPDGFQAFQDCLAEHGVEPPQGVPPGEGAPPDGAGIAPPDGPPQGGAPFESGDEDALGECQDLMPAPPQGQGIPPGSPPGVPLPDN